MATASIVSGGRVEIIAGRGSSADSFPLFGYGLDDYDRLYADKLGLLLAINDGDRVSWESPFRPPLKDALVVPRPDAPIPIWLGTGGNPDSTVRAGQAGLPVSYGILSGTPQRWGQFGALYREAARQAGADESSLAISVAAHGFVGRDGRAAKALFFHHEQAAYAAAGRFAAPPRRHGLRRRPRRDRQPHHRPASPPRPHPSLPPDGHRRHAPRRGTQVHRTTQNRGSTQSPRRAEQHDLS